MKWSVWCLFQINPHSWTRGIATIMHGFHQFDESVRFLVSAATYSRRILLCGGLKKIYNAVLYLYVTNSMIRDKIFGKT